MFNKYYQDELAYLRELGREFAQAYPALAPMLADRGVDPDVERLLEGVAFLTGRIRQKLDDEIPEFVHSVAALLFPHLVRPLPSASILELTPLANALRASNVVPTGTEFASVPVDGVRCTFRSTMPCTVNPIAIESVSLEPLPGGRQQLAIVLRSTNGAPLANALTDRLRLHFTDESQSGLGLLLAAHRQVRDVAWVVASKPGTQPARAGAFGPATSETSLGPKALGWVGFEEDEGLLPFGRHVFQGFRLLEEYYVLPAKFAFVDILGVKRLAELDKETTRATLALRFERPLPTATRVSAQNVRLHCVPIVNVFRTTAEPIRMTPTRERFLLRPAGLPPAHGEVYAVTGVEAILRGSMTRVPIPAFYEFARGEAGSGGFYTTHLAPSVTGDGADLSIAFGTPEGVGNIMDADTISIEMLATNRASAGALRPGDVCVHTTSSPAFVSFANIGAVTPHVPPPLGRELQWRAIAHVAMTMRSLTEAPVLRSMLDVYNLHAIVDRQAARANELRTAALRGVKVIPEERLYRGAVVRGVGVEVELEEEGFSGDGDLFLFCAVLERLLGEYVSINSFSRATFRTVRSKLEYKWPPRSGNLTLL